MNQDLKNAIEFYCSMLPNSNGSANPNDDKRLYTISYYLVKTNESFDEYFFKQELRKNSLAGLDNLNDTQFDEFAENRIEEIKNGRYILERIANLIIS